MYCISYKCVVGEVGSYFQLAVTFFSHFLVSPYQTRDNVVPQFIFDPPFHKSESDPDAARIQLLNITTKNIQPPSNDGGCFGQCTGSQSFLCDHHITYGLSLKVLKNPKLK